MPGPEPLSAHRPASVHRPASRGKGSALRAASIAIPAPFFQVGSGLTQYLGAALAVTLFAVMTPAEVAWVRIATGAVVLLAWRCPRIWRFNPRDLAASALFGIVLGGMNICFYEAIHILPLGVAVSLEFLGPVTVAVVTSGGWSGRIAGALAFAGVACIGGLGLDLSDTRQLVGAAWVLGAAALWAGYIVMGQSIASRRSGITNLALGCGTAALVFAPFFSVGAVSALNSPKLVVMAVGVGVLSTVIPYSLEALAMGRLSAAMFALFNSLLPATSALIGAVTLRQLPSAWSLVGLVLISVAVGLASYPPQPHHRRG